MPTSESRNAIEKLLQDRAQFVSWLTRLNSTGGESPAVPEAVRGRVRADYERRLEAVLEELRGHTNALEEQVAGLVARAGELTLRESQHKEHLSEAEVRHLVGEYDETKWDGIRSELLKVLAQVHEELRQTNSEVDRLNEVLATIRTPVPVSEAVPEPPAPEPAAPPPMASGPRPAVTTSGVRGAAPAEPPPAMPPTPPAPAPVSEPMRPAASAPSHGTTEIPFRATPPKPQPRAPAPPPAPPMKEEQPGRTLWFPSGKPSEGTGGRDSGKLDELAFLKSVTGNEPPAAPPAAAPAGRGRASGGFTRAPEPPAAEPPPEPKTPTVDPGKDRGSAQKTLKCAECGTLNRPTEWYCERCGAELAAL
ncbi:MAG: zinc finger Ran-binding domain-containing protein [Gemmatimonadota bacterium]|nr:zinc finger Ran-binding domain-containing protein [Gemmatimonadota bacterium]